MKKISLFIVAIFVYGISFAQNAAPKKLMLDSTQKTLELPAACGTCMFKMKGKDCELAIIINGKSYFVDGKGTVTHAPVRRRWRQFPAKFPGLCRRADQR